MLFTVVSCTALFAMKFILWAMFKWGGIGAIGLALIFTCIYVGSFFTITKKWAWHEQYVSLTTLKLIWALGFVQLAVLGTFTAAIFSRYHRRLLLRLKPERFGENPVPFRKTPGRPNFIRY